MDNKFEIPYDLYSEIINYCKSNNIDNYNDFLIKTLKQGFTVVKYGSIPLILPKTVEDKPIKLDDKNNDIKIEIIETKTNKDVYGE